MNREIRSLLLAIPVLLSLSILSPCVLANETVRVSWTVPIQRKNGELLSSAEIGGYRLYMVREVPGGTQFLAEDQRVVDINNAMTTELQQSLSSGTWHIVVHTYDINNLVSEASAPQSIVIP